MGLGSFDFTRYSLGGGGVVPGVFAFHFVTQWWNFHFRFCDQSSLSGLSRKPYQSSDWPSCHFHRCDRSALPSNSVAPERSSFSLLFSVTALNEDRTVRPLDRDVGFMVACPAKSCKLSS